MTSERLDAAGAVPASDPAAQASSSAPSRDDLREAGRLYFNKVLSTSSKETRPSTIAPARRRREKTDADVEAIGAVIEGSRLYVVLAACLVCRALGILLLKESMEHLETPAFLLFLHQLPLLLGLWALSSQKATTFDIGHLSSRDLQAAIPEAVLVSLQLMLFFASLNFGPALVVVAITATAGVLLPALFPVQILQAQGVPSLASLTPTQTAVAAAAGGAVLELLTHKPLATNTVVYLALWGTLAVLRGLWGSLCESPDSVGAPAWLLRMQAGRKLWDAVSTAAGSAQRMDAGVLAFLAHLLSFVPVLVLGFLFQEGSEIIQHEVSVPSFTVMLGSCLCFAVAEAGRIVLVTRLSPTMQAALDGSFMVMLGVAACMADLKATGFFTVAGMLLVGSGVFVFRREGLQGGHKGGNGGSMV